MYIPPSKSIVYPWCKNAGYGFLWKPCLSTVFDACSTTFDPLLRYWSTLILIASHRCVCQYDHVYSCLKCYPVVEDADQ